MLDHLICKCIAEAVPVGHELVMLAKAFPDGRQIIGVDLADGMVDLANSRCVEAGIRSFSDTTLHVVSCASHCMLHPKLMQHMHLSNMCGHCCWCHTVTGRGLK